MIEPEWVPEGAKGAERLRKNKAIKKYLSARRSADHERQISYRTEAVLGLNMALKDGAPGEIVNFLKGEYLWAMEQLRENRPEVFKVWYDRCSWTREQLKSRDAVKVDTGNELDRVVVNSNLLNVQYEFEGFNC